MDAYEDGIMLGNIDLDLARLENIIELFIVWCLVHCCRVVAVVVVVHRCIITIYIYILIPPHNIVI